MPFDTLSTRSLTPVTGPQTAYTTVRSTSARTMFTAGPAAITTMRFHTGWLKYARGATSGDSSSCGFMPVMRT